MSIVGGLVHTQSLPATAGAGPAALERPTPLARWFIGHAWAIIFAATALFWLAVATVAYLLA